MARTDQMQKIADAAAWMEARQTEVLPEGFSLQQVQVDLPEVDGIAPRITFTWSDDHYNFTVS